MGIGGRDPPTRSLPNPNMSEKTIVAQAINRLKGIGYVVRIASDGVTRYVIGDDVPTQSVINRADGTYQAVFHLERPGHYASLFVVWGLGEYVIADVSADSADEQEMVEKLVFG
jgi:hypothetical protein